MTSSPIACSLCARANPLLPQHGASTQVGALLVCGGHVDEAFKMVMSYATSPAVMEQLGDQVRKVLDSQLSAAIECVLRDHADELDGENVDANLAELAHCYHEQTGWTAEREIVTDGAHSPAEPSTPVTPPTGVGGETTEAHEARE
jgi:hypothetical protein